MLNIWSQDIFSKGELSPLMYSRVTVNAYYNGMKTARNAITYPQGATGKRFGTLYLNTIPYLTQYQDAFFESFQYLNECCYVIILVPDKVLIYLEGTLVATVTGTGYTATQIATLDSTVLDSHFRVTSGDVAPKDLVRTASAANIIVSVASNEFTLTTPITAGLVIPVRFTSATSLPVTNPQIRLNKTYFVKNTSTSTVKLYSTATDAAADLNAYVLTTIGGAGANNLIPQNTWTFSSVVFSNYPVFDFSTATSGNYDAITFTPAAVSGYNIQVTAGSAIFTAAMVGGEFAGNGGISRIITVDSTTVIHVNIVKNFADTSGIPGTLVFLAEPAWSNARGWPEKCSSFQNRAVFSTTGLLPNGLWLSVTNDYNSFDDLEADQPDSAISWFPSSDNVNYIRFIVPYRSLTIHTNTGIYSTPLSFEQAITPENFSMTLQDSTPATAIQPRGIDNQIVILSGNDVHSMLWDGFNNSYTSTIASIANEHLIRSPHDEASYVDLNKAGSRYMFIINDDGSMVIFQTLISENVQGFTPAVLEQTYGNAYFRWVTSSSDGRAWFLTEREIATEQAPLAITGFFDDRITVPGNIVSFTVPTAIQFTTAGSLPVSSPQVVTDEWYWALAVNATDITVYLSQQDALDGVNAIMFSSAGVTANVVEWALVSNFMLEQLSFDVFVDCATVNTDLAASSITGQSRFNAQTVKINGDGYGFENLVIDNTIEIEAHGEPVEVGQVFAGFAINTTLEPLQVSPPGQLGYKGTNLAFPDHIRVASFMFNDTIGGTINGTPIQLQTLNEVIPGNPPEPLSGLFEMSFMLGWSNIDRNPIIITHSEPFDIKLIGIWYKIEE